MTKYLFAHKLLEKSYLMPETTEFEIDQPKQPFIFSQFVVMIM
jgi:hypothetical protein